MNSNHNNLPPARVTTDQFKSFCDAQDLRWLITWKWQGRNRAGVLRVHDRDDNLKARVIYGRNTQKWGLSDHGLDRLRTGSPKHLAVLEAQKMLEPLSGIKINESDC